jgi:hydrogenase maturation protease
MTQTLIIGYGNTLRGDDGVGQILADHIAALDWPHCQVLSVHQLTPELAAAIAKVDQVIFIDAMPHDPHRDPDVQLQRIYPTDNLDDLTHRSNPTVLLTLAKALYDKTVKAWWVLIPAVNFEYGETLSTVTQQAQVKAMDTIRALVP